MSTEKSNNKTSIVYVLSNPAGMPGMVKIGITERKNVEERMKELYGTGVPVPFKCEYACEVEDCNKAEKALHTAFYPNRVNTQREFFNVEPEQVIVILSLISKRNVTPEVEKDIQDNTTKADKVAGKKLNNSNRPQMNFTTMKIPMGSILKFVNDDKVEVEVIGERLVKYNGEEKYLSQVTRKLLGLEINVQPSKYWEYEGRNLKKIYEETYSSE